jgi:hypothetical protein
MLLAALPGGVGAHEGISDSETSSSHPTWAFTTARRAKSPHDLKNIVHCQLATTHPYSMHSSTTELHRNINNTAATANHIKSIEMHVMSRNARQMEIYGAQCMTEAPSNQLIKRNDN